MDPITSHTSHRLGGQSFGTQPLPGIYSRLPEEDLQPATVTSASASIRTRTHFDMGAMYSELSARQVWGTLRQIRIMPNASKFVKGRFLLDGGSLVGSFFQRTVVLVCQHDAEGAFGLVLNRATEKKVGEVLVADLPDSLKDARLYLGGPVQPSAMSYLHSDSFIPDANVLPNLSLGHSLDTLLELGESFSPTGRIKMFAGYAGWSAGQLEDELKRKAWLIHPASLELVFDTPPEQLWQVILRRKGGWKNKLLSQMPEDLTWN